MRRGFTLHEIIISLTVMSGVLAVAAHFSVHQLRFLRTVTETQSVRTRLAETSAIIAAVLANAHPAAGDILVAEDSVLEVRLTTGVGVVCAAAPGRVLVPGADEFLALSANTSLPQPGDRMDALLADSAGTTWLSFSVDASAATTESCGAFPSVVAPVALTLVEPMTLPAGAPVRFTRPFRLSHYRSSDGLWYLGGRDWNGADRRFNIVQPLAGPLLGREGRAEARGLTLQYLDSLGNELSPPADLGRIAAVRVVVRAAWSTLPAAADSLVHIVSLRR